MRDLYFIVKDFIPINEYDNKHLESERKAKNPVI